PCKDVARPRLPHHGRGQLASHSRRSIAGRPVALRVLPARTLGGAGCRPAMTATTSSYDAIVIGGGPAGSTAAAVLAAKGRRVVVLEKEKFPRYHIGESLLPYGYFTMERIGVLDKIKKSAFTKKYSVQFVSPDGRASVPFYFHTHLQHEAAQTWQVLRSEFDQLMLDNAREKGAVVHEETTVREGIWENGGVVGVKAVG